MTLDFDPADDFAEVADFQRAATLLRPGTSDAWPLVHARRAAVRASEVRASGGRYAESDAVWHLDAAELNGEPTPGDVIVETGEGRWTVLAAQRTATGRWRCVCRDLAVAHGLDDYVDIETAVYTKDSAGAETATWHPWRTGVPARVQPVRSTVVASHDRRAAAAELVVYVAERLDIDHTHRIRTPDGAIYRVVGCRKAQWIDALMEIDVIRD
jgi:head-tail adaptor